LIGKDFLKSSIVGIVAFGTASLYSYSDAQADMNTPYGQSLKLGSATSIPIGHYEFCKENPSECKRSFNKVPRAVLTASLWEFIRKTDIAVNARIMRWRKGAR